MARSRRLVRRRPAVRGFTLIEVIVAFGILAVALAAILQAFGSGLRGLGVAETRTTAVLHARSKLDEVGVAIPLEAGIQSGEFDDGFTWEVAIERYEAEEQSIEGLPAQPYRVEVRVSRDDAVLSHLTSLRLGAPNP